MDPVSTVARSGPMTWSTLTVRGPDSESFLQGQISQDLSDLPATGRWSLVLAPDSVVITTCWVLACEDGYDLVVERELLDATLVRLSRFLLRSKCVLSTRPVASGPFDTHAQRVGASWPGSGEFGAGLTPHSFGSSFVEATVSFRKGCFTGQELVARLDARGSSVPWRFVKVRAPSVDIANALVRSKGPVGPQGVTTIGDRTGGFEGLAIAHRSLVTQPDDVGSDVEVWPIA